MTFDDMYKSTEIIGAAWGQEARTSTDKLAEWHPELMINSNNAKSSVLVDIC